MFQRITVVCTGNICRSPIAEALLSKLLSGTKIKILSAGVAALQYHPADAMAQQVMQEHGFDISAHRARQVTQDLLAKSDLILSLDQGHSDWILSRFPEFRGRVFKLGNWRGNVDIADPYRKPKSMFDKAFLEINNCTEDWAHRIHKMI